ncbi:hypothetical protein BC835DRAFT_1260582 [Cytidiella melzeri]|nr:hypothetical protein BC835DRAFT_1260582 [Cytidiella melzeri]
MSRRPSVASLSSIGPGIMKPISLPTLSESGSRPRPSYSNGSLVVPSRSASYSVNLEAIAEQNPDGWEPDDLFTKYTVGEVKATQQRLRMDADAKQEELRLMVGERYRDLLQASTSIISIAQSSSHVLSALNEVRAATSSIGPTESERASVSGRGDDHLQTLQSLAAHLKLLLDAPEHLWRFMERKLYLHAAWLFLLSRVVHRSLLRGDADDDAVWRTLGIDISEQFPIVQRQWDTVSQFRTQISHKATMALREQNSSPSEVCAILLTLHLLESRPLPETLATFLAQRTRSLNASLNRTKDRILNGNAIDAASPQDGTNVKSRRVIIREVKQKLKAALEIVVRTMGISRRIFIPQSDGNSPLMNQVLHHVQNNDTISAKTLPAEVRLTSQTLLTTLPSSNHFLLLPPSIKWYKPYIDGSPLLASAQGAQFKQKLDDWFEKAMQNIRTAMELWFAELSTIRDLWELRRWCQAWLQSAEGLDARETGEFRTVLDSVCRQLAVMIWKSALKLSEVAFREHLDSALETIGNSSATGSVDAEPAQYLFHADSAPSIVPGTMNTTSSDMSFQIYRSSLRRQMTGRTPLLDDVLSTVEKRAKDLHEDLLITQDKSEDSRVLTSQLAEDYRHDAEMLCSSLTTALQTKIDGVSAKKDILATVFLGRTADHISSSYSFMENIGCAESTTEEFRSQLAVLYDCTLERWQNHTVSSVIAAYLMKSCVSKSPSDTGDATPSARPSARLLDSLLALSSAIQALGIHTKTDRLTALTWSLLRRFVVSLVPHLNPGNRELSAHETWDLAFLQLILECWGPTTQEQQSLLLASLPWSTQANWPSDVRDGLSESLSRSQILLGLLLPPKISQSSAVPEHHKSSSLLQLGLPAVDAQYQPAFDLVKPSARFGLLLVGSSVTR